MTNDFNQFLADHNVSLRDFSLQFARMLASLAVDPHGYFEKKYACKHEALIMCNFEITNQWKFIQKADKVRYENKCKKK